MEAVNERPTIASFTPLTEHQEQTPIAFFGSRPVLHAYAPTAKLFVQSTDLTSQSLVQTLKENGQSNSSSDVEDSITVIENLEIWVTSQELIIYSTATDQGISLTYPSIALHALGKDASQSAESGTSTAPNAVFLQINLQDPEEALPSDMDIDTLDLTLVPLSLAEPSTANPDRDHEEVGGLENGHKPKSPVEVIFAALSACADLHPDPQSPDEDAAETMPGAGGWITSDSMGSMDIQFDEDGNFIMPGGLGAGAGSVRPRDDEDDVEDGDEDESKWQRTG